MPALMTAGRLRQIVRIEQKVKPAPGTPGQPKRTWATLCEVRACVEDATAGETWRGPAVRTDATETVTIRHRADVADAGANVRVVVLTQGNRVLETTGVIRDETGTWLNLPCKAAGKAT